MSKFFQCHLKKQSFLPLGVCGTLSHTRLPHPGVCFQGPSSFHIYLFAHSRTGTTHGFAIRDHIFCLINCVLSFCSYFSNLTAIWGLLFFYINLRLYFVSSTNILPIASHCNNLDTQLPWHWVAKLQMKVLSLKSHFISYHKMPTFILKIDK